MTALADAAQLTPAAHDNVLTTAELRAHGMSEGTIARRCRPGGPWRRLLPGIVLLGAGEPTRRQLVRALARYVGGECMVTGGDALDAHGVALPRSPAVHILVPKGRRMLSPTFAMVERTARPPEPVVVDGIPFAPAARAALDAARREPDPGRLRDLLSLPIYYGLTTAAELRAELDAGSQRGSAAVRSELRAIDRDRDTYVHGWARAVLRDGPLPPPRWDVTVYDRRGRYIGTVDAWWDEVGMGWQFHPPGKPHLGHLALAAAGVTVVRTDPERLTTDRRGVLTELAKAFRTAADRRRPSVQCLARVAA
ncbi:MULTISPECIES: hypothetical protein [Prauserella salsuginis group]|uniref:Transcriptional regulator, AbiEi antitoxin, Type IV TA system n=1 Tax=Prauserella salsuginis TaxID=387889 RepID=A0ABW6G814_9PSEU|nr:MULTISPECIES: hypothetical protein [Prauserella salsuginis group]MCR3719660.1 hypothetical protein [Prauserella flava]MCR3735327.1 hypothetical protein [Prauserella salsuginis]